MSYTNAAWGAVKEHRPGGERPGWAADAELRLNTVMTILELRRLCRLTRTALQWSPNHCDVGGSD